MRIGRWHAVLLLAACSYTPPRFEPYPVSLHGTYRFADRVSGSTPALVVEGEFTIQADTILAGLAGGFCQAGIPANIQAFTFRCGTATLWFDRHNPLQRASYSIQGTATVQERVCYRYGTNSRGEQICLEYRQQRNQVTRVFGGVIRPIPVP